MTSSAGARESFEHKFGIGDSSIVTRNSSGAKEGVADGNISTAANEVIASSSKSTSSNKPVVVSSCWHKEQSNIVGETFESVQALVECVLKTSNSYDQHGSMQKMGDIDLFKTDPSDKNCQKILNHMGVAFGPAS